jgi:hypothetical protein
LDVARLAKSIPGSGSLMYFQGSLLTITITAKIWQSFYLIIGKLPGIFKKIQS